MNNTELPPCHVDSPDHEKWLEIVQEMENEGCDTSDAQSIADTYFMIRNKN